MQRITPDSPIQGVIFDFGSTLAIARAPWPTVIAEGAGALTAALREAGLALPPDFATIWMAMLRWAIRQAEQDGIERPAEATLAAVLASQGYDDPDPGLILRATDRYFAVEESYREPAAGAAALLAELRAAGYRTAILSNTIGGRWVQHWTDLYGFRPHVDTVVTSDAIGHRKPRPEAFTLTIAQMGLSTPQTVIMVGDTLAQDISGAQALGMRTVLVSLAEDASFGGRTGQVGRTLTPEPSNTPAVTADAEITRLADLIPILARWQAHGR